MQFRIQIFHSVIFVYFLNILHLFIDQLSANTQSKYAKYTVFVGSDYAAYFGTGVIIHRRIILTSASKLYEIIPSTTEFDLNKPKFIVAGLDDPEVRDTRKQIVLVSDIVQHTAFVEIKLPKVIDIGAILLKHNLELHPNYVEIAKIPIYRTEPNVQDTCVVASRGDMDDTETLKTRNYTETKISIVERQECQRLHKYILDEETFCIVEAETKNRPCNIIAGSAVFCNDTLMGVVGKWPHCTNTTEYPLTLPRICTTVSYFDDWLSNSVRLSWKLPKNRSSCINLQRLLVFFTLLNVPYINFI